MIFVNGEVYQGEWTANRSHGNGVFISDEGWYKGEWVLDAREGYGTFIWPDGRKYTGLWQGDKPHGKVTYIDQYGRKVVGEYVEGEFVIENLPQPSQGALEMIAQNK